MKKTIVIVQGVIRSGDKYLVMRRAVGQKYSSGKWEFPAGKPKDRETMEDALIREIKEETGMSLEPREKILHGMSLEEHDIIVVSYTCESANRDVTMSHEHTDFAWSDMAGVKKMDISNITADTIRIMEGRNVP